jgi:O-methyltransferase
MKISTIPKIIGILCRLHKDDELAFRLQRHFARFIGLDYRFSFPQMAWWKDEDFNGILLHFPGEVDGCNTQRRWFLHQACKLMSSVNGDTAECGVFKGCGSFIILKGNLHQPGKTHHIFDSFEGISSPGMHDGKYWVKGAMFTPEMEVMENLKRSGNERCIAYKGWIPDRFSEVADKTFSLVHIDVDLYEPTRDSFAFFYNRLNVGGIIICDDYGFTTCPGATKACDEFLFDKPEKMFALPDGGGFIIKGGQA